jgi:CheY-like chemotaxis protein
VVSELVLSLGHTVETATNGLEALTLLESRRFHVAILDFLMPKKTGLDVLNELKRWTERPRVVLLSAISPKTLPALTDAAPDAILEKPVKQKQLEKILAQIT